MSYVSTVDYSESLVLAKAKLASAESKLASGPSASAFSDIADAIAHLLRVERLLREPLGKPSAGAVR